MKVSINRHLIDKDEPASQSYKSQGFEPFDLDRQELADRINQGYAFSFQFHEENRNKKNFAGTGFVALDFDGIWTVAEARQDAFIRSYAAIFYTTVNHLKPGKGERFRVVFELPEPVTDVKEYEDVVRAFIHRFEGKCDPACKDAARMYFGSKGSNPIVLNGTLSQQHINDLVFAEHATNHSLASASQFNGKLMEISEVRKMLDCIGPQPGYEIWRNIVWAVTHQFCEEGVALINEWSSDDQNGAVVDRLYRDNNGSIKMGTLIYYAQQHGYSLPADYRKKTSSKVQPGPIVLTELFCEGHGYVADANILYRYQNGYYEPCNEQAVKSNILHFLADSYPNLASTRHSDEAFKYVLSTCYRSQEVFNPSGLLNIKNGVLRFVYDEQDSMQYELLEHNPEIVHTYQANVNYEPLADSQILDNALLAMLPDANSQRILLGTLAAAFDIQKVRSVHGRCPKALFLLGQGANGKDTIREWIQELFSPSAIASLCLQDFAQEGQKLRFSLDPVTNALFNWGSENTKLSLSENQSLKAFISGDPMLAEPKGGKQYKFTPRSVALFNINELPNMGTKAEAILSRFGIVSFPNVFKRNPTRPNERIADPRLKSDPQYIREHILPAFLNRLLAEYQYILANGIDYSSLDCLLSESFEPHNHMATFIEEAGLIETTRENHPTPVSIVHRIYEQWCRSTRLIEDGFNTIYHDERNDRIVRQPSRMKRALDRFFPALSRIGTNAHNLLTLRFSIDSVNTEFFQLLPDDLRAYYHA